MAELEIVVRARDQLTATLRSMGAAVAQFGDRAEADLRDAGAAAQALGTAAAGAGGSVQRLGRERDSLGRFVRVVQDGGRATADLKAKADTVPPAARGIGTAFTAAGTAIKSALLPLVPIFGVVGAAFFAKKAAEDSLEFTAALGQIRTGGGLTEAEITSLGEAARATARSLGLADADAGPVLLAAVTDGAKNAADGIERYNAAVRLASVTGGEAKRAIDVLSSALNAYAKHGLGAARASDVLFEVSRAGKVGIDELAGGLEGVLPLASQLGIGIEELGAVLVTATRSGGGFEQGVQAIRATLSALTDISEDGAKALRGIDYSAAAIRARGLVPVLADISERLNGNSDAIRAVFPDGRSFGTLLAVLANDGRDLSEALNELVGSSGAVEDALGRKLQSPLVQLGIIANRLRSELGERLGAAFADAVSRAVAMLGGLEAAAKKVGDIGKLIGAGLGSGLGALGVVIADQAERLTLFIEKLGGADAIVKLIEASARTATSALSVALVVAREFFKSSIEGLQYLQAGWAGLLRTLGAIPGVTIALDALIASPAEARARVEGLNNELRFLEEQLGKANSQKLKIAPDDTAGIVLINSRIKDLEARLSGVRGLIAETGTALGALGQLDVLLGTNVGAQLTKDLEELQRALDSASKPRTAEVALDIKGDLDAPIAPKLNLRDFIEGLRTGIKRAIESASRSTGGVVLPIQLIVAERTLDGVRRALSGIVPDATPYDEMLDRFRGGIEPSLEAQADTIDRQVVAQRNSVALLGALGMLDEGRLEALTQATDELDKQADALRKQSVDALKGQRLEAISLGLDVRDISPDDLQGAIAETQRRLALEAEATKLRVPFSVGYNPEQLTAQVRDAKIALERAGLEDQAIEFGITFSGVDTADLQREVDAALAEAQALVKQNERARLELDAIKFGVKIDEKSSSQLRAEIDDVKLAMEKFSTEHPVTFDALNAGVDGFSAALGAIASGAQSASEAMSGFFRSFISQVVAAIAKAYLLKAIMSAIGGGGGDSGSGDTSPDIDPGVDTGDFSRGGVFAGSRGMAVPAMAAAALVAPFALGGGPHLDRIVSAPTYAPLSSLAGSAVVPLSGGGIETTSGDRIPVRRLGRELVVAAAHGIAAPLALYGEAGPEAIMRTYAAPGGGPGLRMESGGIAPLTRVSGGRLGVALGAGGVVPLAMGGMVSAHTRPVAPVNVAVPVSVNVAGGVAQDPRETEARLQAAISGSARVREAIAAVVSREMEARPSFRANVRGDRV